MASNSPERSLNSLQHSTMRRADSTRSTTSSRSARNDEKQQLINALEAEEEKLVNTLTRKLEKLRAEKVELENVLEAESESLVLRLQRQLSLLMQQQQQSSQPLPSASTNATPAPSPPTGVGSLNLNSLINNPDPLNPPASTLIEALKTENSNLRNRLVDTERDHIKTTRQSEMYRSELIALRQRVGLPIDDLIGTAPAFEESYPSPSSARRRSRGASTSGNGIPIPGLTGSEVRRRSHHTASISSSSIQLPSNSFTPSTPMTPNSLIGDSATAISFSHGTTSLTTPSTSYPGLPVPHSTPAASPANGRQHVPVPSAAFSTPLGHSYNYPAVPPSSVVSSASRLSQGLNLTEGTDEDGSSTKSVAQSPVSPVSLVDGKPGQTRSSEIDGISRQGHRIFGPITSQMTMPGGPGRPEARQQSPISNKD